MSACATSLSSRTARDWRGALFGAWTQARLRQGAVGAWLCGDRGVRAPCSPPCDNTVQQRVAASSWLLSVSERLFLHDPVLVEGYRVAARLSVSWCLAVLGQVCATLWGPDGAVQANAAPCRMLI